MFEKITNHKIIAINKDLKLIRELKHSIANLTLTETQKKKLFIQKRATLFPPILIKEKKLLQLKRKKWELRKIKKKQLKTKTIDTLTSVKNKQRLKMLNKYIIIKSKLTKAKFITKQRTIIQKKTIKILYNDQKKKILLLKLYKFIKKTQKANIRIWFASITENYIRQILQKSGKLCNKINI